jgi:hypothetical protein
MDDTKKMLKMIISGQSVMKSELLTRIDGVEKKLGGRIDGLDKKIDGVEKRLTTRIDKLGKSLAYLEDDAPTRDEFDNLEVRVKKVEQRVASAN